MATKHDLMAFMSHHIGKGKGISGCNLAAKMGTTERQVRTLISGAREDGIAICGKPMTGYYIANTTEDLQETLDFLKHRALHSLHLASRLSNIPLADLVGQLHINT